MIRRLLALLLLAAGISGWPATVAGQDRPPQADGIVRLLLDLENAVSAASLSDFRAIAIAAIPEASVNYFQFAARGGPDTEAIVRERARRPVNRSYEIIADVLVSHGGVGRIATWQLTAVPDEADPGRYRLSELRELAAVDSILKLRLDTSRQFDVNDLVITAPDFTVKVGSGSAFVAESPNGVTALVVRGRGEVEFTPPDPAEQVQLRIFGGNPEFRTRIDTVFLRLNPGEFAQRITEKSLEPVRVNPVDASRAQDVFDDRVRRTYNIDLQRLTPERWSLEPTFGSLVVEVRTGRYGWLTYAKSPGDAEDITFFDRDNQHNISLYASKERLSRRGRFYSDDDGGAYDIEHHRLSLTFDPARLWVSGRASLHLRIAATSVTSVTIRLAQPLAVASVSSPGLGELLALRIVGQNSILVGLPTFVQRGDLLIVDVVYGGRLDPQALDREAIAPQGQSQRMTDPDLVMMTPEPRYLYSNRVQWYPQGPGTDYATADLRLIVPSEYQIVASGSLRRAAVVQNQNPGRTGSKSLRVLDYVADRPVRYLSCVISRFVPIGQTTIDVPGVAASPTAASPSSGASAARPAVGLEVVSTSRMVGRNRQTPEVVADMLKFFATTIGEAPYPDFTLAALDDNLPGGHSPAYFAVFHQALPTTPYSWASDPVAFDDVYPPFFMAHEVAHQWWGQAVGWKNYHDQWLSEGLAQYFAVLYAAKDRGQDFLDKLIEQMRTTSTPFLSQGPISLGYRLGHLKNDGRVFRAIVYNKSAVVLHMLRRLVGDDAFFDGLRRFYREWRFKKAGAQDLQAAFEAAGTMKLDRFFDRWVRGFERPRVKVTWTPYNELGRVTIRVEQEGDLYDFPLSVVLQYRDGSSQEHTIKVTDRLVDAEFQLPSALRSVALRDSLTFYENAR